MNGLRLALVASVAPDLLLCAVQQVGQHVHIRYRGCRGAHRVHNTFLAIHADVRFGAEIPLVPLARLVRLLITLFLVFFVEEGAAMIVASTMVPVTMRRPLLAR